MKATKPGKAAEMLQTVDHTPGKKEKAYKQALEVIQQNASAIIEQLINKYRPDQTASGKTPESFNQLRKSGLLIASENGKAVRKDERNPFTG